MPRTCKSVAPSPHSPSSRTRNSLAILNARITPIDTRSAAHILCHADPPMATSESLEQLCSRNMTMSCKAHLVSSNMFCKAGLASSGVAEKLSVFLFEANVLGKVCCIYRAASKCLRYSRAFQKSDIVLPRFPREHTRASPKPPSPPAPPSAVRMQRLNVPRAYGDRTRAVKGCSPRPGEMMAGFRRGGGNSVTVRLRAGTFLLLLQRTQHLLLGAGCIFRGPNLHLTDQTPRCQPPPRRINPPPAGSTPCCSPLTFKSSNAKLEYAVLCHDFFSVHNWPLTTCLVEVRRGPRIGSELPRMPHGLPPATAAMLRTINNHLKRSIFRQGVDARQHILQLRLPRLVQHGKRNGPSPGYACKRHVPATSDTPR